MAVRRSSVVQFASLIVLTFSLVLLSFLFTLIKSARYTAMKSQQNVKLELFFKADLKPETDFEWVDRIKSFPEVLSLAFLNQQQAQDEFKKMMLSSFGSLTEEASLLSRLPASISVQFQDGVSAETKKQKVDDILVLAQQIASYDGYIYQQNWAQWLGAFTEKAEKGIGLLALFVFLGFFLIVSNMVRSQVVQKQDEIEILSFLGATPWQIEKPFITGSIIIAIVSTLLSSAFVLTMIQFLQNYLKGSGEYFSPDLIQAPSLLEFYILGIFVILISTYAARSCVRDRVIL